MLANIFLIVLIISFFCLILGLLNPRLVIRWGLPEKRNRKKVLITYTILMIASFNLFGITTNANKSNTAKNENKVETKEEDKAETKQTFNTEKKQETQKWQPKEIAEFNKVYRDKSNKNPDGSYLIINVSSINKGDNVITVNCFAPSYQLLKYSLDRFMAIDVKDEEGNSLKIKDIGIDTANNEDGKIVVSGDLNKAKYIEIMPYKTINENFLFFEIK